MKRFHYLLVFLLLVVSVSHATWWDSSWSYRKPITIDNTGNSNSLTDYQVKVELNSSNFDFSKANSDGSDIRFVDSDDSTELNYWIESWDSSGEEATIWVKVPSIPASSTKTIYMYYGNPSATSESNGTAVFNVFIDFSKEPNWHNGSWYDPSYPWSANTKDSYIEWKDSSVEVFSHRYDSGTSNWRAYSQALSISELVGENWTTNRPVLRVKFKFNDADPWNSKYYHSPFYLCLANITGPHRDCSSSDPGRYLSFDYGAMFCLQFSSDANSVYEDGNNADPATGEEGIRANFYQGNGNTICPSGKQYSKYYTGSGTTEYCEIFTEGYEDWAKLYYNGTHMILVLEGRKSSTGDGDDDCVKQFSLPNITYTYISFWMTQAHDGPFTSTNNTIYTILGYNYVSPEPTVTVGEEQRALKDCSTISLPGKYFLVSDITDSSATKCFNIQANNVVLDCQGHLVDGIRKWTTYGVYVYRSSTQVSNITIENCNLKDWIYQIYFYRATGNTIRNTSITHGHIGLYVNAYSYNNVFNNLTIKDNTAFDVWVHGAGSCNNQFTNVIGTNNKPIVYYHDQPVTIRNWNNNVSEIILCNADHSVIDNVTMIGNENNMILLRYTDYTNVTNIYVKDVEYGVRFHGSHDRLENITALSNWIGIYHDWASYATLKNVVTQNNGGWDLLYYTSDSTAGCSATFENVTGSDNKPIVFYGNQPAHISNWNNNVSEIILCNADHSVIDNVTIDNSVDRNSIWVIGTDYSNFTNLHLTDMRYGLYLWYYSENNIIRDSTITSSSSWGMRMYYRCNNNLISNVTFNSNYIGLRMYRSNNNTITNCKFEKNSYRGIYMYYAGDTAPNKFYNDLFNNTNNFYFAGTKYENYWNSDISYGDDGVNIVGGPWIGGNYWGKPDGTGFSDTCTDNNMDGFCDSYYTLSSTGPNIDYLPLSKKYDHTPPSISFVEPTPEDKSVMDDDWVYLSATINDERNTTGFFDWNRSLVAYISFDNISENTIYDESTYGNDATFHNGVVKQQLVPGMYGRALKFDGKDDYAEIPVSPSIFETLSGPITIEVWFKTDSLPQEEPRALVMDTFCKEIAIYLDGSKIYGLVYGSLIDGGEITPEKWHHAILVHDHPNGLTNTVVQFYLDGDLKGEKLLNITTQNGYVEGKFLVGVDANCVATPNESSRYFNGTIDEVRIWNRALRVPELKSLFALNSEHRIENNFTEILDGSYEFYAYAKDKMGNSAKTGTRKVAIDTLHLKAETKTDKPLDSDLGKITLAWPDKLDNEKGFRIERSTDGSSFTEIATVGSGTTSYTDDNLEDNQVYYYRIRAYTDYKNSSYSNIASAVTKDRTGPTTSELHISGWWNGNWKYCRDITVSKAIDGYQYKVELNSSNFDFSKAKNDGSDIRIVDASCNDGGGEVPYWIEYWNSTEQRAIIWFKGNSDTNTKYSIYYGNPSATSKSSGENTFQYFDHWTSDNTGDWTHTNTGNNHHHWWYKKKTFDTYREFQMVSKLVSWNAGSWDHTVIGWTKDDTNYYKDVDHVTVYWEHKTGNGANSSHVFVKLHLNKGGTTYTTALKSFPVPSPSDLIRTTLKYYKNRVEYEMYDITTKTLLASDSITDPSKIPDISNAKYLFFQAWDVQGGIFSWKSPTELNWGNKPGNGGMEWSTDYWFIKKYASPEPTTTIGGEQSIPDEINQVKLNWSWSQDEIQPEVSNDGLVARWDFEEGSGFFTKDNSGNWHYGIINGASFTTDAIHGSYAMSFDSNGYVEVSDDGSLNTPDKFTVTAWIKMNSADTHNPIVVRANNLNYGFYFVYNSLNNLILRVVNGGSYSDASYYAPDLIGEWHHVAATFDGSNEKLYIDGLLVKSVPSSITSIGSGSQNLRIGASTSGYWGNGYFDGLIDDVRIYNRALSEEEIKKLMLVGYWHFDEGSGSTVKDASGYGNDGTIHGATWTDGIIGKALKFDGVDDYVEIPDSNSLDATSGITIEALVYLNSDQSGWYTGTQKSNSWQFRIRGTNNPTPGEINTVFWCEGGIVDFYTGYHLKPKKWYYLAATYDSETETAKVYVNGELIGSKTVAGAGKINITSSNVLIGKINSYFNGTIDDVRIWRRALSEEEIRERARYALYRATSGEEYKPLNGIWDDFEDGDYTNDPTWRVGSGHWEVYNGVLIGTASTGECYRTIKVGPTNLKDFILEVDVKRISGTYAGPIFRRWKDGSGWLMEVTSSGGTLWKDGTGNVLTYSKPIGTNWVHVKVVAIGNRFKGYINDDQVFDYVDEDNTYPEGSVGLAFGCGTDPEAYFDNFKVIPLNTTNNYTDTSATDTTPPSGVSSIYDDAEHDVSTWSNNNTVTFTWDPATDYGNTYSYYVRSFDDEGNEDSIVDNFEDGDYNGWTFDCGGETVGSLVDGYLGNYAFRINSTGGDGYACAYISNFNAKKGQVISFTCKGYGCKMCIWNGSQCINSGDGSHNHGLVDHWTTYFTRVKHNQNGVKIIVYNDHNVGHHAIYDNIRVYESKNVTVTTGVDGYSVVCDTNPDTLPDTTKDVDADQREWTCTFSDGQANYVHIRSVDRAGNWNDTAKHKGPYWIDTVKPSITYVKLDNYFVKADTTINITTDGHDSLSGISTCHAYLSEDKAYDQEDVDLGDLGVDCSGLATIPSNTQDGTYYIIVRPVDKAGNSNYKYSAKLIVDSTSPVTSITGKKDDGSSYTFGQPTASKYVLVTILCTDNLAGCHHIYYCVDRDNSCIPSLVYTHALEISTPGETYIRFNGIDNAGNEENVKFAKVILNATYSQVTIEMEYSIEGKEGDIGYIGGNEGNGYFINGEISKPYVCSYDSSLTGQPTFGIVSTGKNFEYAYLNETAVGYKMRISEDYEDNEFVIPVTKGGCSVIDSKISSDRKITTPFSSFLKSMTYPIAIILQYTGVDIVGNVSGSGTFDLVFERGEGDKIIISKR